METALPTQSQDLGKSPSGPFRRLLTDAMRFWEPRRLVYNLILAVVVMVWLVASWPHSARRLHCNRFCSSPSLRC